MNQRPSGLSHKAAPCLPLRNIVALLAWSASHCSLFLHLSGIPESAAGGGTPLRPNEQRSSVSNPRQKKKRSAPRTDLWLRRLDLNQRPSGLSHKAAPCLPLRNIVALLAWSASHCSLFLHLSGIPESAAGGGTPLRPNEQRSSVSNPRQKKKRSAPRTDLWLRRLDLNQRPSGYERELNKNYA